MPPYPKPYLSPEKQVELLESRGMTITDAGKAKACLARIGYYRLSAYWYPFRESRTVFDKTTGASRLEVLDDFKKGTNFPDVLDLYVFDKNLRMIVLDAMERIEVAVRTDIALLIGKYDPRAHRDPRYLDGIFARRPKPVTGNTKHQEWLIRQDKKFLDSREDFAKHFKNKYAGDNLPIWIDVELWDFGALSHFYSGLKKADRDKIASAYGLPDGRIFETWLRCLNDVRNVCAHHSRLWNKPLVNRPSWPQAGVCAELDHILGAPQSQTRLYAALVILRCMLKVVNPTSTWASRLMEQVSKLPSNPHIHLSSAGFPTGWHNNAIWK